MEADEITRKADDEWHRRQMKNGERDDDVHREEHHLAKNEVSISPRQVAGCRAARSINSQLIAADSNGPIAPNQTAVGQASASESRNSHPACGAHEAHPHDDLHRCHTAFANS